MPTMSSGAPNGAGVDAGPMALDPRDQRLVVQINDSSESVMSNMAEGFGRGTQEEFVTFLGYALGSLDETQSHLTAAYDREYLGKEEYAAFFREGTAIRKLTVAFIHAMIMPRSGVRNLGRRQSWSSQTWEIYERVTGQKRPERFEFTRDSVDKDNEIVRERRTRWLNPAQADVRATLKVELVYPELLVELEAWAILPDKAG